MVHEIVALYKRLEYRLIFGKCQSGTFLAIPLLGKFIMISEPDEVNCNAIKIGRMVGDKSAGKVFANEIHAEWARSRE